jgi:hypothetical protein
MLVFEQGQPLLHYRFHFPATAAISSLQPVVRSEK